MLLVSLAALLALPEAAQADDDPRYVTRRIEVPVFDLDLTLEGDARTVLDRIERAATRACGVHESTTKDFAARRTSRACVRAAVADTVADLAAPAVTALYEMRRGRPADTVLAAENLRGVAF
jgi:UrcA family protein